MLACVLTNSMTVSPSGNHIMYPNAIASKPQPICGKKTLQQVPFASEEGRRMFREALLAPLPNCF